MTTARGTDLDALKKLLPLAEDWDEESIVALLAAAPDMIRELEALRQQRENDRDALDEARIAARSAAFDEICAHFNREHRERWSPQIIDEIRALKEQPAKNPEPQSGQPVAESQAPADTGDDGVAPIRAAALPDEREGERRSCEHGERNLAWQKNDALSMRGEDRRKAGADQRESAANGTDAPIIGASDAAADAQACVSTAQSDSHYSRPAARETVHVSRWAQTERRKAAPVTFSDDCSALPSWYGKRATDFPDRPAAGLWCYWCKTNTHNDAECWSTRPKDWTPHGAMPPIDLSQVRPAAAAAAEGSATPRTDSMIQTRRSADYVTGEPIDVVHVDDCRNLERELTAATSENADMQHDIGRIYIALTAETERAEKATAELARVKAESVINMQNFKATNRAYVDMDARRLKAEAERDKWRDNANVIGAERDAAGHALAEQIIRRGEANALLREWLEDMDIHSGAHSGTFTLRVRAHLSSQSPEGAAR